MHRHAMCPCALHCLVSVALSITQWICHTGGLDTLQTLCSGYLVMLTQNLSFQQ